MLPKELWCLEGFPQEREGVVVAPALAAPSEPVAEFVEVFAATEVVDDIVVDAAETVAVVVVDAVETIVVVVVVGQDVAPS